MITEPGGNTITSSYIADGNRLLIQQNDEAGDTTNTWMDGLGRTNQVNLFPNSVARTQYSYDALNNLTRVDESGSNWSNDRIRTFTYDSLSRLTSGTNPESGTETYTYDANGNLTRKTVPQPNQANPSVTTNIYYCYDALNRELFVSYTVSCPSYSSTDWVRGWFYDVPFDPYYAQDYTNPIGRVTDEQSYDSRSDNYSSDDFGYDALGRIVYDSTSLPQS